MFCEYLQLLFSPITAEKMKQRCILWPLCGLKKYTSYWEINSFKGNQERYR